MDSSQFPRRSQTTSSTTSPFSRIEPTQSSSPLRSRSSTLSHGIDTSVDAPSPGSVMATVSQRLAKESVFNGSSLEGQGEDNVGRLSSPKEYPKGFDDLPIELLSLVDR